MKKKKKGKRKEKKIQTRGLRHVMSQTPADVVAESDGSGGCVKVSLH